MSDPEQVRCIMSSLFFNQKGYVTEEELSNELPNWREILDHIENVVHSLGISIKVFTFKGQRCFTVCGLPSDYDTRLTDKEAFMLVDFIIRYEALNPSSEGLDKKKWKELINPKLGGARQNFSNILNKLKKKGLLEETSIHVQPGWRYLANLDINAIMSEIRTDAQLSVLVQPEKQEREILD